MQRCRIHAVAQAGRRRPVVEDVAQVGIAAAAQRLDANHAEAAVLALHDVGGGDRLPEARPAGAGIELGGRVEQGGVAADAAVHAAGMVVVVGAAERAFGTAAAGDVIGLRAELLLPLGVGELQLGHAHGAQDLAVCVHLDDRHARRWCSGRGGIAGGRPGPRAGQPEPRQCKHGTAEQAAADGIDAWTQGRWLHRLDSSEGGAQAR